MNIVIEAGPGTGKTTTLIHAFETLLLGRINFAATDEQAAICQDLHTHFGGKITPHNAVFLSFNKSIQINAQEQLPNGAKAYTFNGLGMSILQKSYGFQPIDRNRGEKLYGFKMQKPVSSLPFPEKIKVWLLLQYIQHLKQELLPPNLQSIAKIEEKYGLQPLSTTFTPSFIEELMGLMIKPNRISTDLPNSIEFIDQIWMALPKLQEPIYELAFIDEAQDLSQLRLEFAIKVAKNLVFVGDPWQAINAFAGSRYDVFKTLHAISHHSLPLHKSFRLCPNHIDHANTIRSAHITAFKKEFGPIDQLSLTEVPTRIAQLRAFADNPSITGPNTQLVKDLYCTPHYRSYCEANNIPYPLTPEEHRCPSDDSIYNPKLIGYSAMPLNNYLFITRTNAQVVQAGISLLKKGLKCTIVKRSDEDDIETIIRNYVNSLSAVSLQDLIKKCNRDIAKSEALSVRLGMLLYEKAACTLSLAQESRTVQDVLRLLSVFCTEQPSNPRISTIHKAKGLEAPFVFILFPPIRHPRAKSQFDIEQEINLEFVAETRSSFYKCYVSE